MARHNNDKMLQATALLEEHGIDVWLFFVRETVAAPDPALPYILSSHLTWPSALILTRTGERIAIVGKYDDGPLKETGDWTQIVPYVQSVKQPLIEVLTRLNPSTIAINTSRDDVMDDGLSHGMYLQLIDHLAETPFVDRLVTAERLVASLRGRKSPRERAHIEDAIQETETIFAAVSKSVRAGQSEAEIATFMKEAANARGLGLAWDPHACPIVNCGPDSMVGHGVPSPHLRLSPGQVLHIDFGVVSRGYCSDLQRCWYLLRPDEVAPPVAELGFMWLEVAGLCWSWMLLAHLLGLAVSGSASPSQVPLFSSPPSCAPVTHTDAPPARRRPDQPLPLRVRQPVDAERGRPEHPVRPARAGGPVT